MSRFEAKIRRDPIHVEMHGDFFKIKLDKTFKQYGKEEKKMREAKYDELHRAKFEKYSITKDIRELPNKYLSVENQKQIRQGISRLLDQFDKEQSPNKNKCTTEAPLL